MRRQRGLELFHNEIDLGCLGSHENLNTIRTAGVNRPSYGNNGVDARCFPDLSFDFAKLYSVSKNFSPDYQADLDKRAAGRQRDAGRDPLSGSFFDVAPVDSRKP